MSLMLRIALGRTKDVQERVLQAEELVTVGCHGVCVEVKCVLVMFDGDGKVEEDKCRCQPKRRFAHLFAPQPQKSEMAKIA